MIGEIIPTIYDVKGKPVGAPVSRKRKHLFHGTFPMVRYVSQPLQHQCLSIKEIARFLSRCNYVSDQDQFNREDYWMPPEEFENRKKGDCDDFALWTWRQLQGLGYKVRYVVGITGKYGAGHAWVTMEDNDKHYIVEPLAGGIGEKLPRLSLITYQPGGSVEWDGKNISYYVHEKRNFHIPFVLIPVLVGEWLLFWFCFWAKLFIKLSLLPYYLLRKVVKRKK